MSLLSRVKQHKDAEAEKDIVGGSFVLDSGVYPVQIKEAYLDQSAKGAVNVNFKFMKEDGQEFKHTIYITNAKGDNFYLDKKTEAKKHLPGYLIVNAIMFLTTGKVLDSETETEEQTLKVYDYESKKELPKDVDVLVDLIDQEIALGIIKQIVDVNKKDDSGKYQPTGETREENEIDAVFSVETGLSKVETEAWDEESDPEPDYLERWKASNEGKVRNRAKGVEGKSGKIGGSKSKATEKPARKKATSSIFNKKK